MTDRNHTSLGSRQLSRRGFLASAGAATAAFTILPSRAFGQNGAALPPSERLNVAGIGVGGMGKNNVANVAEAGHNIVALCDVDFDYAGETFKQYPDAKVFRDYRKMLDDMADQIDAVIVATPDHTHAVIAMDAMKRGKHVYVQKPLTHNVWEARQLTEAARKYKVATQMGNQGHSSEEIRLICEWIWAGAIGDIREVWAWTNRPVWPQGIEVGRPEETPGAPDSITDAGWDLWIGPQPHRPYHPAYHPWKWRGWWQFGTGALGDMACHILDPVFWALKLLYPSRVEAFHSTYFGNDWNIENRNERCPRSEIVYYTFPAREGMPEVKVTWYDGGMMPPRPEELEPGRRMGDKDGGALFIGDKGKLMCGCYGRSPRLIPESAMRDLMANRPEKTVPRVEGSHEQDWLIACKGGRPASSNFDYSGPLTEMVVMGNLAVRNPGEQILWDGKNMKVANKPELDSMIREPYRDGWSL
ncbi:MAG: Gfo/Idh/MocA family oxidoreductase [Sedimentisphaerales bacterium]|nr:Gfo/Idh/MocA family oxidoreductase [Sedimentisphaerales bacterium]